MGQFIYGKNSVLDALKGGLTITKIYVSRKLEFKVDNSIEVIFTTRQELDKKVKGNHQGYIAELEQVNYYDVQSILNDKPTKVLILDHIQDPHNFGAIIRTANAAGVKHIIIPKNRAVELTPVVLKTASGGIVGMKIIKVNSLTDAVMTLKKNNFWIYATAFDENAIDINKVTFSDPTVLIVGNEGKGVNRSLLKLSDQTIFIPMKGTVQSLNVSVATGIALFKL